MRVGERELLFETFERVDSLNLVLCPSGHNQITSLPTTNAVGCTFRDCRTPRPDGAQHPREMIMSAPGTLASKSDSNISSSGSKAQPADDTAPSADMPTEMSVLHRLSKLLLDPSHPLQDARTPGAAEAPAAPDTISSSSSKVASATGLTSSPPHLVHQHKSEEAQLCSDMVDIAASYTESKGGGASAAVLRGGGGSR